MPIPFTCPYCGRFTSVADEHAGQTGPCASCGAPVTIPQLGADSTNPYQSPVSTWVPYDESAQMRGGLAWILFSLEGRIPRRVWWMVNILKVVAMYGAFFGLFIAVTNGDFETGPSDGAFAVFMIFAAIAAIPMMWIDIAVTCKRFHDRDKSGWWYLISFVPYLGKLWILIDCGCLRGTYGPNQFGPDPT